MKKLHPGVELKKLHTEVESGDGFRNPGVELKKLHAKVELSATIHSKQKMANMETGQSDDGGLNGEDANKVELMNIE